MNQGAGSRLSDCKHVGQLGYGSNPSATSEMTRPQIYYTNLLQYCEPIECTDNITVAAKLVALLRIPNPRIDSPDSDLKMFK